MTMQQLFSNHNHHKKFTTNKRKKRKTFLNLIHSAIKLKHTSLKLAKGGRVGKGFTLYGKKQQLNHVRCRKTDTLKCYSCPGSVQRETTSFLASFTSSAGKKDISRPIVAEVRHFQNSKFLKTNFAR